MSGSAVELLLSVVILSKRAVSTVIGTGIVGFGTLRRSGDLMIPPHFCSECSGFPDQSTVGRQAR